jgi:twitching motility two-component system response regulator PilH
MVRPPRILVVDDSWTELALMAAPLKEQGYEVITASDGEEAIDKVVSTSPDCVVLDIVMPGQNGFQVCRRIKQTPQGHNIPVIFVSTKNTSLDKQWAYQQGAAAYLTKPFRGDDLVACIRQMI